MTNLQAAALWILAVPLIAVLIWLAPLALIWALNTLFHLGIPYNWSTWAASLIVGGIVGARSAK